jgi:hypothetical protein
MKSLGARVSTHSSPKSNKDTNSRLGNYEILEEIARSRIGVIFSARQRHFHRIRRGKTRAGLSRGFPTKKRSRDFRRETQTAQGWTIPTSLL